MGNVNWMNSNILRLPPTGWCVRAGISYAKLLFWRKGRLYDASMHNSRRSSDHAPP